MDSVRFVARAVPGGQARLLRARTRPAIKRIGIAAYAAQVLTAGVLFVVASVSAGPTRVIGFLIAAVPLVEDVVAIGQPGHTPGQLMLGHRRWQLAGPPRSC